MRRLLREPLVHFLLMGATCSGLSLHEGPGQQPRRRGRSGCPLDEIGQLTQLYQSQWRRPPTPQELDRMVENKVQQEVLYREALAMGLDKDDEIVKRRMAQKMQFLAEDMAAAHEPTTAELRAWFEKNSAKFAQPPRLSFRHLYFSPDRRGARARDDAEPALAKLAGQPVDSTIAGFARRSVHVPGLLPRSCAGLSRQGIRTAVRPGGGRASRPDRGRDPSSPASAGTSYSWIR